MQIIWNICIFFTHTPVQCDNNAILDDIYSSLVYSGYILKHELRGINALFTQLPPKENY